MKQLSGATRYAPAAGLLAAAVILALVFTPLGGYGSTLLAIFQPKEFVPVDLTQAQLHELRIAPQAREFGTILTITEPHRSYYPTLNAARAHLRFAVRTPSALPAGYRRAQRFFVSTPGEYAYTYSAAKARRFAARTHKTIPPMPTGLDGTTVRVHVGEIFSAHYAGAPGRTPQSRAGVEVFEMQLPAVSSNGASFQQLERYVLSLPGISPDLAAQVRELGDLQNRLPVPVNIDKQISQEVHVDGAPGLAIGDNTGLGAGVIWQKDGIVYGIAGDAMTIDQVMAMADGLK